MNPIRKPWLTLVEEVAQNYAFILGFGKNLSSEELF